MNTGRQARGSGQGPHAKQTGSQPYSGAAAISIRLWTPAQLQAQCSEVTWKTGSNLTCMIADLVTTSNGIPAEELRCGMSAHFSSAVQALKAAKLIERALVEFSKQRPDDCFGAAIAIHRPIELRPFLEGDPARPISPGASLLSQARPGQILLSHETYEHLRAVPGLQFRSLNASVGEAEHDDRELLWTSRETYEHFKASLEEATRKLPKLHDQAPPIVYETDRFSVSPTDTVIDSLSGGFAIADLRAERGAAERLTDWIASHLVLGSLVVGILVLVGAIAIPGFHKKPQVFRSTETAGPPKQDKVADQPASIAPPPGEPAKTPPAASVAPPPGEPAETPPAAATSRHLEPPKVAQNEPKPVAEYEDFTIKDVPGLLKRAEEDAGAGDYEQARREYYIVLRLQPNNEAARRGMYRLNLSMPGSRN